MRTIASAETVEGNEEVGNEIDVVRLLQELLRQTSNRLAMTECVLRFGYWARQLSNLHSR